MNNISKILLLICFVNLCNHNFAQKPNDFFILKNFENHFQHKKNAEVQFPNIQLNVLNIDFAVENYASKMLSNFSEKINIKLESKTISKTAFHYQFSLYFNEISIFNNYIKINITKTGKVISIINNIDNLLNINNLKLSLDEILLEKIISKASNESFTINNSEAIYFAAQKEITPKLVTTAQIKFKQSHQHLQFFFDEENIIFAKDLNINFTDSCNASAMVFLPDPLTSASTIYGSPFIDSLNIDIEALNNQRVLVPIKLKQNANNEFILSNQFFNFTDIQYPNNTPPILLDSIFHFTRNESNFEDVNAFYHLNKFRSYIDSLGFENLVNDSINVDVHGTNADNSFYNPTFNPPILVFGNGGVDDAEDADVIVHEYCHHISFNAAPNTLNGFERQAIEEGFADYFAVSYGNTFSDFNWQNVYSWDGHNEFWNGRNANSSKIYPTDITSSFHNTGEIWSSALMEIYHQIGKNACDELMIETLYNFGNNITMNNAALLFLKTDSLLNNYNNEQIIKNVFINRGLIEDPYMNTAVNLEVEKMILLNNFCNAGCNNLSLQLTYPNSKKMFANLYTTNGKLINTSILNENLHSHPLNFGKLTAGIYFLQINENQHFFNFKIMVP